ncbi:hypothetical protein [Paenibacillus polymyxa]|uniref:Uncharacterized protein n=1 Tax=Paenibacillus polymyxa (strain SC2) TaxID=886882 RepID=E3EK26_PAEPS|nr:hypothetical protein [Paenibacillus polymyxa]ADO59735.1 hypothetical protein PPSC2_26495 [Paenibacillus polymyxa SC2]WPQ60028.1 hypothetical protein SKN87_27685 [Paenibacillus polymyxa]
MNLYQVIESGQKIVPAEPNLFSEPLFYVSFCICCSILIALLINGEVELFVAAAFSMLFIGSCVLLLTYTNDGHKNLKQYDSDIEHWKKEIAMPYIHSLPVKKSEVIYIKIDPELGTDVKNSDPFYNLTYSKEVRRTPVVVSFKEGGEVTTTTDWVTTSMELSDGEKPFIEYQRLDSDLGHDVNAGIYNAKIHLPKSYTFTDIK